MGKHERSSHKEHNKENEVKKAKHEHKKDKDKTSVETKSKIGFEMILDLKVLLPPLQILENVGASTVLLFSKDGIYTVMHDSDNGCIVEFRVTSDGLKLAEFKGHDSFVFDISIRDLMKWLKTAHYDHLHLLYDQREPDVIHLRNKPLSTNDSYNYDLKVSPQEEDHVFGSVVRGNTNATIRFPLKNTGKDQHGPLLMSEVSKLSTFGEDLTFSTENEQVTMIAANVNRVTFNNGFSAVTVCQTTPTTFTLKCKYLDLLQKCAKFTDVMKAEVDEEDMVGRPIRFFADMVENDKCLMDMIFFIAPKINDN